MTRLRKPSWDPERVAVLLISVANAAANLLNALHRFS